MAEFKKPDFLSQGTSIESIALRGKQGKNVFELTNLPESIKKKFPQGVVIRQMPYGRDTLKRAGIFFKMANPELAQKEQSSEQLSALIRFFEDQQDFISDWYSDELPNLVAKAEFIMEKNKPLEDTHIYEVMPKIDIAFSLADNYTGRETDATQELISDIQDTFKKDVWPDIVRQLKIFVKKTRDLREQHKIDFDPNPGNLVLTADGQLILLDVDRIMHVESKLRGTVVLLDILEKVADELI